MSDRVARDRAADSLPATAARILNPTDMWKSASSPVVARPFNLALSCRP